MATPNYTAFTWSPNKKVVGNYNDPFYTMHMHLQYLKKLKRCSIFTLYPEFNGRGDLHWHGILEITDKVKWYKSVLPYFRYKGFVCVKHIDNFSKWSTYCAKDKDLMEKVLTTVLPITPVYWKNKIVKLTPPVSSYCSNDIVELLQRESK